jgi:glucokinase
MAYPQSKETKLVFAADLGGTNLRAATIDESGRIFHQLKKPTPDASQADHIVHALVKAARECESKIREYGVIKTTSVAVAGTIDVEHGLVVTAPNIPCLEGFRLADALQNELQRPSLIENDANAAAVGEMWQGAARGAGTIVCITLGTGVGGGIILNGKLWRGVDGSAGEIGHTSIEPFAGVKCRCGNQGCLENYASGTAIVRMTKEALPQYPDSGLHAIDDLTAEKIYRVGEKGDELALEIFRRMGVYLGVGLANLVNVLNPEMIVIAGGVANAWNLFAEHAMQEMRGRAFPLPAANVQIKRGECGDSAGLLGAARLALNGPV